MARSRKISQAMIFDEDLNAISVEAQLMWVRMLAVSDDCGVVPANEYALNTLIAPPAKIRPRIMKIVQEIVAAKLGKLVQFREKSYFLFKPKSFQEHQSYIFNKRIKSDYLGISSAEFDALNLYESIDNQLPVICGAMEGTRYKVQGTRIKEEDKETKTAVAEFVTLTKTEYEKLVAELTEPRAKQAISILNNYKGSKGKTYKSDYLAIHSWVIDRLKTDEAKGKSSVPVQPRKPSSSPTITVVCSCGRQHDSMYQRKSLEQQRYALLRPCPQCSWQTPIERVLQKAGLLWKADFSREEIIA